MAISWRIERQFPRRTENSCSRSPKSALAGGWRFRSIKRFEERCRSYELLLETDRFQQKQNGENVTSYERVGSRSRSGPPASANAKRFGCPDLGSSDPYL